MISQLFQSGGFLMPLIICSLISTVILWFIRTKNPVKRFRPHFGEVAVLGVVLYGFSIGASYLVFMTITESQEGFDKLKEMPAKLGPGASGDSKSGGGGNSVFEESLSNMESERDDKKRSEE